MKGQKGGLFILSFLLSASLPAATLEHAGVPVSIRYGYGTDAGETMNASVTLSPNVEFALDPVSSVHLSARIRGDDSSRLEPGKADFSNYSRASRPRHLGSWGRIELRDAYVETLAGRNLFRIGKQQIVWGSLDGIKVLDVLNPQSFREFILEDFGESRIGLWSAYADFLFDDWRAELAVIPDPSAHEIPVPGAWFELTAPRFRYGAQPDEPGLPLTTVKPDVSDGTFGARISRSFGGADLALQYVNGIDFEPLGRIVESDGMPVLQRYYERRELYGAKLESAFAGLALRMELSYQPDRAFNTRSGNFLDQTSRRQWRAAVGLDMDGPFGLFFNFQYLQDQIMNAPDDLIRPATDRVMTVFTRRQFAYETLTVDLRWYGELKEQNGMFRSGIEYKLGADTSLRLSTDQFYGSSDGLFGQFDGRDRIQITLKHSF